MSNAPTPPAAPTASRARFRVFVDFWNVQLTLNERVGESEGASDARFAIDWLALPTAVVDEAARLLRVSEYSYEGTMVFSSYNANTPEGRKYHKWATSWLDRQAGIQVICFERHSRNPPKCPVCHKEILRCPDGACNAPMTRTIEKGVDTAIATNMIRLAWESAYDVAILASSDADLVPAVEFLDLKGFRVLQAGFPPLGSNLSRACWATIDLFAIRSRFERK